MEAYDNALVNNMMAQEAFRRNFGNLQADGTYQVDAAWQSACSYASTIGAFVGILICGQIQPRLGYRWCIIMSLVMITCFIFVSFFAETLPVLFAGQFLIGLPFGFYNCLAQAYASEIAPLPLRGIFTMYNQSCWCTGQLLTAGILYGFRNGTTKVSPKCKVVEAVLTSVVVQDPIRDPMGLATSPNLHPLVRTRVAVVAGPKWPTGRSRPIYPSSRRSRRSPKPAGRDRDDAAYDRYRGQGD